MRSVRNKSVAVAKPADTVFQAVLGVVQNNKADRILAVHNEGRKLVVREKSKMSNPKFQQIWVEEQGEAAQLHVAVGSDPRTQKALLDGRANDKSLTKLIDSVQAAVAGDAPVTATPVSNHFLQKKTEVPWTDPDQDPEIELDGNLLALYGF